MKFLPKSLWLKVFFSNRYVYTQVVDKAEKHVVLTASTIERHIRKELEGKTKSDKASCALVGNLLADRCKTKDIEKLHYEFKEGQRFHGKLEVLITTLRQQGVHVLTER